MTKKEIEENIKEFGIGYPSDEELAFYLGIKTELQREALNELRRRSSSKGVVICSAKDAYSLLRHYCLEEQEVFTVMFLDGHREVIQIKEISRGSTSKCTVSAKDVFREAMKYNASAIIVSHNHPSGNTEPSDADRDTTNVMIEAGKLVGIPVLDHIIVGNEYYSFMEHNEIDA